MLRILHQSLQLDSNPPFDVHSVGTTELVGEQPRLRLDAASPFESYRVAIRDLGEALNEGWLEVEVRLRGGTTRRRSPLLHMKEGDFPAKPQGNWEEVISPC